MNLPLQIRLSREGGKDEESSITRDISSQGVYCFLRKPLPSGSLVELTLAGRFRNTGRRLPSEDLPARVVRTDSQRGFGMHGVALRFSNELTFFGYRRFGLD